MDDPEEPLVPEEPPVPEEPLVVRPVPIVCQTIAQVHKIRSWKVAEALAREGSLEIHSDANDYPVLVVPRTYLPIRPHDGPVPGQASPREHEGPDVESMRAYTCSDRAVALEILREAEQTFLVASGWSQRDDGYWYAPPNDKHIATDSPFMQRLAARYERGFE